jgi:HEAT repeat protein
MRGQFLKVPRLRVWHLLGLVAVIAAFLAVTRFRTEVYSPLSRAWREAQYGDVPARQRALAMLGDADPERSDTIPFLLAALDDSDPGVRRIATRSLSNLLLRGASKKIVDPRAKEVKARLTQMLHDPDPGQRLQSAVTLVNLKDRSRPVFDCLIPLAQGVHGMNWQDRAEALAGLSDFLPDATATAVVVRAMSDPDWLIRQAAALSLGRWGIAKSQPIPDSVIHALIAGLDDKVPMVRAHSAISLGWMHSHVDLSVPALVRLLDDREMDPRMRAATALGDFGVNAEPALPALHALVDREVDATVLKIAKESAASIDTEIRRLRERTLPGLVSELSEDDPALRGSAATELGNFGPPAREAIVPLRRLLSDPDAKVRQAATAALRQIEGGVAP